MKVIELTVYIPYKCSLSFPNKNFEIPYPRVSFLPEANNVIEVHGASFKVIEEHGQYKLKKL